MRDVLAFARKYLYAAGAALYLFTIGVFSPRHRPLFSSLCRHFGYPRRYAIPEIDPDDVAPDGLAVDLRVPVGINGNISLLETLVLARLVRKHRPESLFEFGTFNGRTTLNLIANAPGSARVYTLDLPPGTHAATRYRLAPAERPLAEKPSVGALAAASAFRDRVTQLTGDSAVFDYTPYRARMDFVFVDGSHARDYVLNDSARALELARDERSLILWHDYGTEGWEGVILALDALYRRGGPYTNLRRIRGTSLVIRLPPAPLTVSGSTRS